MPGIVRPPKPPVNPYLLSERTRTLFGGGGPTTVYGNQSLRIARPNTTGQPLIQSPNAPNPSLPMSDRGTIRTTRGNQFGFDEPTPLQFTSTPAILPASSSPPAWLGSSQYQPPGNVRPPNLPGPLSPTGIAPQVPGPSSFLGGGGQVTQGQGGAIIPTTIPTSSFLGGGGQWVMGPNGLPYYIGTPGPNTFIGAGGEAVRGPDGQPLVMPPPTTGGGGGFGTNYGGWGRGRGRGGGGGYGGYGGGGYIPPWLMSLYSWNYKG